MKTILGITDTLTHNQLSKLDSFVIHYNKIMRKMYVDLFIKKIPLNDLAKEYQKKYFISKRQFGSIRLILQGKVSSIIALNKNHILDTLEKINAVEKSLKNQRKNYKNYINKKVLSLVQLTLKNNLQNKIQHNQERLNKLKSKLKKLEYIRETGNVHYCFGSLKLFRQQFQINTKNNQTSFKNHQQWYQEYFYQRNKVCSFVGSKDEITGNNEVRISHIKDNVFNLKININHKAEKIIDKYVNINFTLNHEVNSLINIIKNNQSKNKELWQALTYRLIKQQSKSHNKDKYVVAINFEKHLIKHTYTDKNNGCLGVDINQDHLAIANLDNKGNLLNIDTFHYALNGNKHQNNNSISLAVKNLMSVAVKLNKPLVIEKLDFIAKKKELSLNNTKSNFSKKQNKQLSDFAYGKISSLIKNRAEDNFIEIKEVSPAYTSLIGKIKYSTRNRISIHHSASICIGRKGLFNRFKLIQLINKNTKQVFDKLVIKEYKEKRISSKNKHVKSSDLPVRNNLNLDVYWKELKENIIKQQQHEKKNSTSLRDNSVMNVSVGTLL